MTIIFVPYWSNAGFYRSVSTLQAKVHIFVLAKMFGLYPK